MNGGCRTREKRMLDTWAAGRCQGGKPEPHFDPDSCGKFAGRDAVVLSRG